MYKNNVVHLQTHHMTNMMYHKHKNLVSEPPDKRELVEVMKNKNILDKSRIILEIYQNLNTEPTAHTCEKYPGAT